MAARSMLPARNQPGHPLGDTPGGLVATRLLDAPGGGEGIRTPGLLRAREALCQLSYTPQSLPKAPGSATKPQALQETVGLCGLEPQTSVLSGPRSNRLS
jgi:hypothetical protein